MQRRKFATSLSFMLAGCASSDFKPLEFAPAVVLQDPLPDKAIIYLLRIPNDRETIDVYFGQKKLATMPSATYTVVSVDPGTYEVAARSARSERNGPPSRLVVKAEERRFLYTSVPVGSGVYIGFIPGGPIGVIPLFIPTTVPIGARTWNECREFDAQGLMSISRLVLPEPGAA